MVATSAPRATASPLLTAVWVVQLQGVVQAEAVQAEAVQAEAAQAEAAQGAQNRRRATWAAEAAVKRASTLRLAIRRLSRPPAVSNRMTPRSRLQRPDPPAPAAVHWSRRASAG